MTTFSGDSIVVTLTAGGTLTLATTSALTGTLGVTAGTHGDSLLKSSSAATHGAAAPYLPAVPDASGENTVSQINTDAGTQNTDWVPVLHG